jgi:hypothetical protein
VERRWLEPLAHCGGFPRHRVALTREAVAERPKHGQQAGAGAAITVARREVGAGEQGLAIGGEHHRHRPAAAAGEHLEDVHVDGVDVGKLFPVDLDRDVVRVDVGRDVEILERLALHDVAPVARRVADAEQYRPAELARRLERFVAPGPPVDRIVCVLQEIRAALEDQPVRVERRAVGAKVGGSRLVPCGLGIERGGQPAAHIVAVRLAAGRRRRGLPATLGGGDCLYLLGRLGFGRRRRGIRTAPATEDAHARHRQSEANRHG